MNISPSNNQSGFSQGISLSRGPVSQPSSMSQAPATGGLSLRKGERISLTKDNPSLNEIMVGLGWDVNEYVGPSFDLDVQVFMLKADGKVLSDSHFIFYNQKSSPEGSVVHSGDNTTGVGQGDDEVINVKLQQVPAEVQKLVFTVTIHEARLRNQTFGRVNNAFIRVVDKTNGNELVRFNITEKFSRETALVVGEIYRYEGEWKFNAVGAGYEEELLDLCRRYGVNIA